MKLDAWLDRISSLHPVKWDLGLDRVRAVAEKLDVLKPSEHIFLVAGTNGKGSACEALEALAIGRGMSVGKSTSPHLIRFNERIVVNGKPVSDEAICDAFSKIDTARAEITLSYFEFGTLAALYIFKERELDVSILEIGLGGRLDAMNIVEPDVSIITRIAMDHESWLGTDRDAIAREKAGIMRAGKSCLIADTDPPASLAECAAEVGARALYIGKDFGVSENRLANRLLPRESLVAATAAFEAVFGELSDTEVARLNRLVLPGRFQVLKGEPRTIVDVAHNPDAATRLEKMLRFEDFDRCRAVFGMYADKDIGAVVDCLMPVVDEWYLSSVAEERSAKPADLAEIVSSGGGSVAGTYDKVCTAYDEAFGKSDMRDLVLVFGSFPVVGEVLEHRKNTWIPD